MSSRVNTFITALVVVPVIALVAVAEVPSLVNYQGRLENSSGDPVTTPVTAVFAIWNDPTAGDSLWSEQRDVTPDADGLFDVLLGSLSPIPDSAFSGTEAYLSIKIGTDPELVPRKQLVSVPYAFRAGSTNWSLSGDVLFTNGDWGIARAGNVLFGLHDSTHVNLGVACTTGFEGQDYRWLTVSGGVVNRASGEAATVGGGYYNTANGPMATVAGGQSNHANGFQATVSGGYRDTAIADYATVAGGFRNTASDQYATIGGGRDNTASGIDATVGGGRENTASYQYATISGGQRNTASGYNSTVGGGGLNTASGSSSVVPGGLSNVAAGAASFAAGFRANALHQGSFVWADGQNVDFASTAADQFLVKAGGGVGINLNDPTTDLDINGQIRIRGGTPAAGKVLTSTADGTATWETPAGASDNDWVESGDVLFTSGDWGIARAGNVLFGLHDSTHVNLGVACTTGYSGQNYRHVTVGGGVANVASQAAATVGGGYYNSARGAMATVAGGQSNCAIGLQATVSGGYRDTASANYATVSGGFRNTASDQYATISGGYSNTVSGIYATISGGRDNTASSYYSVVPGGFDNLAAGYASFAAGYRANALHDGSFVWADYSVADFASTAPNQFLVRAGGGVGLGIDTAYSQLTVKGHITPGDSAAWDLGDSKWWWRNIYSTGGIVGPSDRRLKDDVEDLDYGLEEVLKLRPVSFTWKNQTDDQVRIGFVAQEVQPVISEVVNTGDDPDQTLGLRYEKLIPVLVNAIKEQQQTIDDLRGELAQIKEMLKQ